MEEILLLLKQWEISTDTETLLKASSSTKVLRLWMQGSGAKGTLIHC